MDEWQAGGGLMASCLAALLVWVRKRRKGGRLRFRIQASYRSPPGSTPSQNNSTEPPPFPKGSHDGE